MRTCSISAGGCGFAEADAGLIRHACQFVEADFRITVRLPCNGLSSVSLGATEQKLFSCVQAEPRNLVVSKSIFLSEGVSPLVQTCTGILVHYPVTCILRISIVESVGFGRVKARTVSGDTPCGVHAAPVPLVVPLRPTKTRFPGHSSPQFGSIRLKTRPGSLIERDDVEFEVVDPDPF